MSAEPTRRSPLQHRSTSAAESGALRLAERPLLQKFILRGDAGEASEAVRGAMGLPLPREPLTSAAEGGTAILWLGPDEWMLVMPPADGTARIESLRAALSGIHHQIVGVGDYYTAIEVAGSKAREALMKLTTLDLHPRAFKAGMVAGSLFARTHAVLWQEGDRDGEGGPLFLLIVRWSMADYLWCMLADAGREWGMPEETPIKGERLVIGG